MLSSLMLLLVLLEPPSVVVGASEVRPGGSAQRSLTGTGVTVGVWDLGVPLYTHQDFVGRLLFQRSGATDAHATAVAGMISGNSVGLAPGASVRPYLFTSNYSADLDSIRHAASNGLRLSVHPYSYPAGWEYKSQGWAEISGCTAQAQWLWRGSDNLSPIEDFQFGFYSAEARHWDAMLHEHPRLLTVVASGNMQGRGPQTQPVRHCHYSFAESRYLESDAIVRDLNAGMTAMALSKNTLTVSTWPNEETSGRGPTDDGRIKPDIVAPESVADAPTSASVISYGTFSKTSAASSVATGALALVHEHLTEILDRDPLASTLKAVVIHTATDKGDPGPDPVFGWGLVDVEKAVRFASLADMREASLSNGETHDIAIEHAGYGDLVATLVWTDPQGPILPASMNPGTSVLVNDLDLRILGAGGAYLPLAIGGGTADNSRDNVEMVRVSGLPAGTYTIRINHKGTLDAEQAYALVVSSGDPQRRVFTVATAGWRLISVPFESAPFSRISDSFITQFGGATGEETLYRFTSSQAYRSVTDPDTLTQPGHGYLLYVFDADAPKEWIMDGTAVTGQRLLPLPWNGAPNTSFVLAGNPFHGVLDWDAVVATSTGIANSYYVWDPSVSSGGGSSGFKHYTAGNPGSGDAGRFIPAFSGFFAFATQPDAELVLDPESLIRGAQPVFHGKVAPYPQVRLSDGLDEVVVSMHPEASEGWDRYDVPQLSGLDGRSPLTLIDAEGVRYRAIAVPESESEYRIRLSAPARITHNDLDAALVGDVLVIGRAEDDQPDSVALLRAWPNPFNPVTTIGFSAQAQDLAPVRLVVIDMLGREVAVLVDAVMEPGEHSVTFDASNLASGVYLVRMRDANGRVSSLKLTLLK